MDTLDDTQSVVEANTLCHDEAKALVNTFASTLAEGMSKTDVYTLGDLDAEALVDSLVESYQKCTPRQFATDWVIWRPRHWPPGWLKRLKR